MKAIVLAPGIRDAIIRHAEDDRPNECCGLLAGHENGHVTRVIRLVNHLNSPIAFRSDPWSMRAAMRSIDERGLHWLAVYHSHPRSLPVPSRRDRTEHFDPAILCVIVGWSDETWSIRAWRMDSEPTELPFFEE